MPSSARSVPLAARARTTARAFGTSSQRSIATGTSRRSASPGRCRRLTAGSREKAADRIVSSAKTPNRKTRGERRLSGGTPWRAAAPVQAIRSRTETAYAAEIWEVRSAKVTRRTKASLRGVTRRRRSASRGLRAGKSFVDQHHRDVGHDRIDEIGLLRVEPLRDDGLLVAELLAVLLDEGLARRLLQLHELEGPLGLRADEDGEQLRIDGHMEFP